MSTEDHLHWDQHYQQHLDDPYPPPYPLLFEYIPPVIDGSTQRALDLAGGLGQNGLWLAEQGYVVDIIDISRVALTRAQGEINRRGIRRANLLKADINTVEFKPNTYTVLCVCFYLHRGLFSRLRACVQSGGRVAYAAYNKRCQRINPTANPDTLLEVGELAGYFADWHILHNVEDAHVAHIVAVKP
jgi:SAM-dependent methyltransferase